MHIPVNRWTVGAVVLALLIFGNDIVEPLFKALAIMMASHIPAY